MRLGEDARKSVVFFGLHGQEGVRYGGTGFLLEFEGHKYLVTARHVAEKLGNAGFVIRVNMRDGTAQELEPDWIDWAYHADPSVDIAISEWMPPQDADIRWFPGRHLATSFKRETKNIGPGSLVHIVGLFRLMAGKQRNLAVVHTGHIALNPEDERIPVKERGTNTRHEVEGYLVEAQTLEGLSGSPVFVRRSIQRTDKDKGNKLNTWVYGAVFLLGVYQSAWDAEPGAILAGDRGGNEKMRVPVGMGVVVPAEKILEVLSMPKLKDRRAASEDQDRESRAATLDDALPTKGDNPQHKEDFNSLLHAAARKRPQGDQT